MLTIWTVHWTRFTHPSQATLCNSHAFVSTIQYIGEPVNLDPVCSAIKADQWISPNFLFSSLSSLVVAPHSHHNSTKETPQLSSSPEEVRTSLPIFISVTSSGDRSFSSTNLGPFILEYYVGNTVETIWLRTRSCVFQCISFNTNTKNKSRFQCE